MFWSIEAPIRQGSVPDDSLGWLAPFCVLVCLSVLWTVLPRRSELTLERDLFLIVFLHLHRSLSFFRSFILVYKKNTIQMAKVEEYRRHNLSETSETLSQSLFYPLSCATTFSRYEYCREMFAIHLWRLSDLRIIEWLLFTSYNDIYRSISFSKVDLWLGEPPIMYHVSFSRRRWNR